ncbi:MAG: PAS domain S-box protein [Spirochaetaceae bacterium]|nr:PAS domain S-box protein [Spirochaetaceae bacterium]
MILKKINEIYKDESLIIKSKAKYLSILIIVLFILTVTISIQKILTGTKWDYYGYAVAAIFSLLIFLVLIKGFYKQAVTLASILFSFSITLGISTGELKEYEVMYIPLVILFTLLYSSKKMADAVIVYFILFLVAIYYIKTQTQLINTEFLFVFIGVLSIFFILTRLHLGIIENYINTENEKKESLKQEVLNRIEDLKKAKEYSDILFNNSPIAIYSLNKDRKIVNFNKKAQEITGYSEEDVIGKELNIIIESLNDKGSIGHEYRIKTINNNEKIIEKYNAPLKNKKGELIGEIDSFIDITSWKELEDFRNDIQRIIRHDLKTPLNSIIGFPKMMLTDESLSDEYKEYLMIILTSGQNMLNMINATLSLFKLEAGTYQLEATSVNIISVVKQISSELREIRQRKGSVINILLNGDTVKDGQQIFINTEKSLIYMILTNLIKNALEASPKESPVTVSIEENNPLTLTVHNRGTIPEEIRNNFFDKYVTFGKRNGNGLGTYSAKLMAEAINADLYFETDEHEGTTLFLTL